MKTQKIKEILKNANKEHNHVRLTSLLKLKDYESLDDEIHNLSDLRVILKQQKEIENLQKEVADLKGDFIFYETSHAESLAGIALRELGNEYLWTSIARLNETEHPYMNAHDYYPVGSKIKLPVLKRDNTDN